MDLTDFYRGGYVDGTYGNRLKENFKRILALPESKSDNTARVKRVLDFAKGKWGDKKVPNLLDVGSGLAVFPFRMKEAGWHVTALDPDRRAAAHASENAGVKSVHADFLKWEPKTGAKFDVITLNKVLEHVEDPITMMAHARKWIQPGGVLYIEVPNVTAAQKGPGREEFFIEHLHVFSESSLVSVAQREGWSADSVFELQEPSGKLSLCAFFSET
jgi:2-polyprenyl-3-methyl-5-hydroxy-6-metoxy-1,4-benzoquinol methylase